MSIHIILNGVRREFEVTPGCLLLELLRREAYYSVKHGCETGDCGVCTVLLDEQPVTSCIMLAEQAHTRRVDTLDGLAGDLRTSALKQAFVDCTAIQCGYCTPAMIVVATALLRQNAAPSETQVRDALAGILCRCTGYVKPVEAIMRAAQCCDR